MVCVSLPVDCCFTAQSISHKWTLLLLENYEHLDAGGRDKSWWRGERRRGRERLKGE